MRKYRSAESSHFNTTQNMYTFNLKLFRTPELFRLHRKHQDGMQKYVCRAMDVFSVVVVVIAADGFCSTNSRCIIFWMHILCETICVSPWIMQCSLFVVRPQRTSWNHHQNFSRRLVLMQLTMWPVGSEWPPFGYRVTCLMSLQLEWSFNLNF